MATLSHIDLLMRVHLFEGLSRAQAEALASCTKKQRFKRNETIVQVGQKSQALYVLLTGTAKVTLTGEKGKEIVLAQLESGDCVGEMSLIDGRPHSANVVATSMMDVLILEFPAFKMALLQNSHLALSIMRGLVKRLRNANQKISDLATVSVYGRVAKCLLNMAIPVETVDQILMIKKFSILNLAKEVGASREMVSKAIKDFERQRFIIKNADGSYQIYERRKVPR